MGEAVNPKAYPLADASVRERRRGNGKRRRLGRARAFLPAPPRLTRPPSLPTHTTHSCPTPSWTSSSRRPTISSCARAPTKVRVWVGGANAAASRALRKTRGARGRARGRRAPLHSARADRQQGIPPRRRGARHEPHASPPPTTKNTKHSDENAQPRHLRVCRHGRRHGADRDPAAPAPAGRGQKRAVRVRAVQGRAGAGVRRVPAGALLFFWWGVESAAAAHPRNPSPLSSRRLSHAPSIPPRRRTHNNQQVIAASVTTNEGSQLKSQIQALKLSIEKLLI
jgi:hypothetical protein